MNGQRALDREDIVSMLVAVSGPGGRTATTERIDSLELARLIYEVESRLGVELGLGDDELERMGTVSGAVEVIHAAMARHAGE